MFSQINPISYTNTYLFKLHSNIMLPSWRYLRSFPYRFICQNDASKPKLTYSRYMPYRGAIFTGFSHEFILFWMRRTSLSVKTYQISSHVFICESYSEIIFIGKSFPNLFLYLCYPYFGTFRFHVVPCTYNVVCYVVLHIIKINSRRKPFMYLPLYTAKMI